MAESISFRVYGIPAPQGSKRHVGNGRMIESSKKVTPWREAVKAAFVSYYGARCITGPVVLYITFLMPRPKKPKCRWPDRMPDLSKLIRSTEDALTEVRAWEDDARVVAVHSFKKYESGESLPGAWITIRSKRVEVKD